MLSKTCVAALSLKALLTFLWSPAGPRVSFLLTSLGHMQGQEHKNHTKCPSTDKKKVIVLCQFLYVSQKTFAKAGVCYVTKNKMLSPSVIQMSISVGAMLCTNYM